MVAGFTSSWWLRSKLISVLVSLQWGDDRDPGKRSGIYRLQGEAAQLALAIIADFEQEVGATGADFMIVNLPDRKDLERLSEGRDLVYSDLLAALDDRYQVVHTEQAFDAERSAAYFAGHYNPAGNRVVAEATRKTVSAWFNRMSRTGNQDQSQNSVSANGGQSQPSMKTGY